MKKVIRKIKVKVVQEWQHIKIITERPNSNGGIVINGKVIL